MKKLIIALAAVLFAAAAFADTPFTPQNITIVSHAEPQPAEYVMVITGCDWGPAITKLVMNVGHNVLSDDITPEDFEAAVTLNTVEKDSETLGFGLVTGSLDITDAYLCDGNGEPLPDDASRYIALDIAAAPWLTDGDPFFHFPIAKDMSSVCGVRITSRQLDFTINERTAIVSPLAGQFTTAVFSDDYVSMNYAWWLPPPREVNDDTENDTSASSDGVRDIPLIVWFHGMGEDGDNPYLPLFGTKSTNLIADTVQRCFDDGAAVLIPQSPTNWLETTTKDIFGNRIWAPVDIKGFLNKATQPIKNFFGKFFTTGNSSKTEEPKAAVSYYTIAIKGLLEQFLSEHPEIDRRRIYVGGCSAGGYMTINMCIQAPELFAAAFPVCGIYPDSKITDKQIEELAKMPLWFTHARNDTTVRPETHSMATVARLRAVPAHDLHYTLWDDVHDLTGTWKQLPEDDEDEQLDDDANNLLENEYDHPRREPYQYSGHYSWIYVLNNDCIDNGVSLFEWLSMQRQE